MNHEQRIKRLEAKNRKLTLSLAVLGMALCGGVLMGQIDPRKVRSVIRAKRFEVINDDGHPVVTLRSWEHGGLLVVQDHQGRPVAVSGSDATGNGTVYTVSPQGKKLVRLGTNATGNGAIAVNDSVGRVILRLVVNENGGAIGVGNRWGKIVGTLMSNDEGAGEAGAFTDQGRGRKLTPGQTRQSAHLQD
jgi:hypothetical protein